MQLTKLFLALVLFCSGLTLAQTADTTATSNDSLVNAKFQEYYRKLTDINNQRIADSIKKQELEQQLQSLKNTDNLKKEELLQQLQDIEDQEKFRLQQKKSKIDSLRKNATGYPVVGVLHDTLFKLYSKVGAFTAKDRAQSISKKIKNLYDDDFFQSDSLINSKTENTVDVIYKDVIVMSVSETDAIWYNQSIDSLASDFNQKIKNAIVTAKEENTLQKWLLRIGLALLVLVIVRIAVWLVGKGERMVLASLHKRKGKWFKSVSYKDYTFLSTSQFFDMAQVLVKILKWAILILFGYISLPIIFSIFPFTRGWADKLFHLIWSPFKKVLNAVWDYIPNLFSILVIVLVMRYFIKFVRYIFNEIKEEKLKVFGFYPDWAIPTFNIVRFLLYAFMFILIFPYLPGSDSEVFKGVSVFLGVLFSLGSSSAIANMISGLVITYMRPFKIGDRIKLADISGDVIEKTLLVTRLKTIKNEIITIPNSSILTGNTINYTVEAEQTGLIVHTTVTIGYDIPWTKMHQALEEAANRTDMLLKEPKPFVLQTSLDDFYVSYQLNAYTKEASKQALIYSQLHQNIQDVCNENGIEILSPHYRAGRDGSESTIPASYRQPSKDNT